MNLTNILSRIAQADTEDFERPDSRRNVVRTFVRGASLAALPVVLGALFNKAEAQTPGNPVADALNGSLLLEYMQEEFYSLALGASVASSSPLIPSGLEQAAIIDIRNHATAHVNFLKSFIKAKGGVPIPKPKFDFTGGKGGTGGNYSDVFTDYAVFLMLAQCFEDITVRAYKASLATYQSDNDLLTATMRLHSVEARHAAHVREMRKAWPDPLLTGTLKPWITLAESNIADPDLVVPYLDEDNTLQANIQIKAINGQPITDEGATEAFDEPQALAVIAGFVVAFIAAP